MSDPSLSMMAYLPFFSWPVMVPYGLAQSGLEGANKASLLMIGAGALAGWYFHDRIPISTLLSRKLLWAWVGGAALGIAHAMYEKTSTATTTPSA